MPDTIDTKKALKEAFLQGINVGGFGEANEFVSDSAPVKIDAAKAGVLGSGMGSIMGMGRAAAQAKAEQEAAKAMGAMSEAARRQAAMAEFNKPRPAGMGMGQPAARMPKMYKDGGKVSKSGRSYRGYGKARIPS